MRRSFIKEETTKFIFKGSKMNTRKRINNMLIEDVNVGLEMATNKRKCNNRNRKDDYLINVRIKQNTEEIMIL